MERSSRTPEAAWKRRITNLGLIIGGVGAFNGLISHIDAENIEIYKRKFPENTWLVPDTEAPHLRSRSKAFFIASAFALVPSLYLRRRELLDGIREKDKPT